MGRPTVGQDRNGLFTPQYSAGRTSRCTHCSNCKMSQRLKCQNQHSRGNIIAYLFIIIIIVVVRHSRIVNIILLHILSLPFSFFQSMKLCLHRVPKKEGAVNLICAPRTNSATFFKVSRPPRISPFRSLQVKEDVKTPQFRSKQQNGCLVRTN